MRRLRRRTREGVEVWVDGGVDEWVDIRGVDRFSSLVKQNKKLKIALSFASPEKEKYFVYIYDVIAWEKLYKRFRLYYFSVMKRK